MRNWMMLLLLGVIFFAAFRHFGVWDALAIVAIVYMFSPQKMEI